MSRYFVPETAKESCGSCGQPGHSTRDCPLGISCFLFTAVKFHRTFMAPIELAEMTVPEDHLYQRLMARKLMVERMAACAYGTWQRAVHHVRSSYQAVLMATARSTQCAWVPMWSTSGGEEVKKCQEFP